jgi:3-oxoacyl-[acyl-carrier protein] reductase
MLPGMTTPTVTGPVIAVVAGDAGFGAALVGHLARRGASAVVHLPAVDEVDDAAAALHALGAVSAVVHVCGDDSSSPGARPLVSTEPGAWATGCERVLWRAVTSLQAAHAALARRDGGRIVVVTATAGVSGAPRAVPFVAAVEGVRAMAKSAGRQWGAAGIAVNCVSVPLELLAPALAAQTTFLPPAAIPRDDPVDDIAGAIEFLTGPGARGISGATVVVDGGAVMAP